jgi:hypothetical protein
MILIVLDMVSQSGGAWCKPVAVTVDSEDNSGPGCGDLQQQRVRGVSLGIISSPTLRRLPN